MTQIIVYKACAGAESEVDFGDDVILVVSKFSEAYTAVKRELNKIKNQFMWDVPEVVLFFSDSTNFRKEIMPAYKGHRNRKKPCGYKRVINALKDEYEVVYYRLLKQMIVWVSTLLNILVTLSLVLTRTCDRYLEPSTTWMKP